MPLPTRRQRLAVAAGTATVGLTAGVVLGSLGIANAATSSSSTSTPSSSAMPSGGPAASGGVSPSTGVHGGLPLSGTVTAVGRNSVTIRTSSGTTAYAVTSASDIDKNGEASLSSLLAGDPVTFSTSGSGATLTIDKLHAGNDSLDWPSGPPSGMRGSPSGSQPPPGAPAPTGSSSAA